MVIKYLQRDVDVLVWYFLPSHPDGSETKKKLRYFGSNPSLRISGISQCLLTGVQLHIFALDVKHLGKDYLIFVYSPKVVGRWDGTKSRCRYVA